MNIHNDVITPSENMMYLQAREKYQKELLTPQEASEFLGISKSTLDRIKKEDSSNGPQYKVVGKTVKYPLIHLVKYTSN